MRPWVQSLVPQITAALRTNQEPGEPAHPSPYQAPGWNTHSLIQINLVSLHSGFVSSLVRVPSVNGKFFDSRSCSSSCLCPSAGLELEKERKGEKKNVKSCKTLLHLAGVINALLGTNTLVHGILGGYSHQHPKTSVPRASDTELIKTENLYFHRKKTKW